MAIMTLTSSTLDKCPSSPPLLVSKNQHSQHISRLCTSDGNSVIAIECDQTVFPSNRTTLSSLILPLQSTLALSLNLVRPMSYLCATLWWLAPSTLIDGRDWLHQSKYAFVRWTLLMIALSTVSVHIIMPPLVEGSNSNMMQSQFPSIAICSYIFISEEEWDKEQKRNKKLNKRSLETGAFETSSTEPSLLKDQTLPGSMWTNSWSSLPSTAHFTGKPPPPPPPPVTLPDLRHSHGRHHQQQLYSTLSSPSHHHFSHHYQSSSTESYPASNSWRLSTPSTLTQSPYHIDREPLLSTNRAGGGKERRDVQDSSVTVINSNKNQESITATVQPPTLHNEPTYDNSMLNNDLFGSLQRQFKFSYTPANPSHKVYIGLEIIDVDLINDAKNFFSLQLYLIEMWHEPRLNITALKPFWDGSSDPIPLPEGNIGDCLWKPELLLMDTSSKDVLLEPTSTLLAYQNKVIIRKSRHALKVACSMNLQIYPMDKHVCKFELRTWSDPVHKVDLWWLSQQGSPKPELLDAKQNRCVIHSEEFTPSLFDIRVGHADRSLIMSMNQNYSTLNLEFIFERRIIHTLLTVYIPSSLVVTLSWLQFWFDVEAVPGRMSLGIMSTLTIITQIVTNYEKAGNHVTAVDIWLFVCLIMVFLALMEYAFAYTISHYYDTDLIDFGAWHDSKVGNRPDDDVVYSLKHDGDLFLSGPVKTQMLRNSLRNRLRNSNANDGNNEHNLPQQTHHQTLPRSNTPVNDFEPNSLFHTRTFPQMGAPNRTDVLSSTSKEESPKGISSNDKPSAAQSQSPQLQRSQTPSSLQPNQIIEDEESSKLLVQPADESDNGGGCGRAMGWPYTKDVAINEALQSLSSTTNLPIQDELFIARLKIQIAVEEYYDAMRRDEMAHSGGGGAAAAAAVNVSSGLVDEHSSIQPANQRVLPYSQSKTENNLKPIGGGKKRRKRNNDTDANNNSKTNDNSGSGSGKSSHRFGSGGRFSSIRRQTLRRQFSSRMPEDSRCGGRSAGLSEVDYYSRYIFPTAFVIFMIIYWITLIYFKLFT